MAHASDFLVIAHRGASGYLPEHTLPSYALAYALGADFIEPDLVMTRDGHLIAMHDIHLESTTNVALLFPDRKRGDGRYYAADFTLEEVKRLAVSERRDRLGRAVFGKRFRTDSKGFQVPTFIEVVEMVQELNRQSGCSVGVYPETKGPSFHDREGLELEKELLRVLAEYGYQGPDAAVFVQSFEPGNLIEMREMGTDLPLIQLMGDGTEGQAMVTPEGLDRIATYAHGIGPSKLLIEKDGEPTGGRAMVAAAQERGLAVHPYTFRADQVGKGHDDFASEVRRFIEVYKVDGLFSDQADQVVELLPGRSFGLRRCD